MKLLIGISMVVGILLLSGFGYNILHGYEEVCVKYQLRVTAEPKYHGELMSYSHKYTKTTICLEYALRKKTGEEPFIYNFDWCTTYPNSEDCNNTPLEPCACCGDLCQRMDCDWDSRYQIDSPGCNNNTQEYGSIGGLNTMKETEII